jgi:hypothetical protein
VGTGSFNYGYWGLHRQLGRVACSRPRLPQVQILEMADTAYFPGYGEGAVSIVLFFGIQVTCVYRRVAKQPCLCI